MEVTTENGKRFINKKDVEDYRATSSLPPFNCVIYLKNGESIWVYETFEEVDNVFDF